MKKKTALEMFKEIKELEVAPDNEDESLKSVEETLPYFCEKIEQALQRLDFIDNAEASEALECLEEMWELSCDSRIPEYTLYDTIKQALLKAQENARSEEILQKYYQEGITLDSVRALKQERDNYKKVLETIKEKNVEMALFNDSKTVEDYNYNRNWGANELTEDEFSLLKEALK